MAHGEVTSVQNAQICHEGRVFRGCNLQFSTETGLILSSSLDGDNLSSASAQGTNDWISLVDLDDGDLVAPGLIELQTNGLSGVHFTQATNTSSLEKVAVEMAKNGVTAWYATVPTIEESRWKEILPFFTPRSFDEIGGSPLLGAHVEGPYLHPSKKGAHDDSYFKTPSVHSYRDLYGEDNLHDVIKYITIAPELDGSIDMIRDIRTSFPHIVISLGHSTASYDIGTEAITAGATSLTHIFNAMNPLHHRDPGLAGTIGSPLGSSIEQEDNAKPGQTASLGNLETPLHLRTTPYFSMIPDLIHLHPAVMRMCYLTNPSKCILITDSIELAGLPDGVYPPNGQITYAQRKQGNRVTNVADASEGEKETLIGSCITLPEGVRNMFSATGLSFAQVVPCASTNVADLMRDSTRGRLTEGRRADFVVFDGRGIVKQTWIAGRKVFEREPPQDRDSIAK